MLRKNFLYIIYVIFIFLNMSTISYSLEINNHRCRLEKDNTISCWGDNSVGQLGSDSSGDTQFVKVFGIKNAKMVFSGYNNSCAVLKDDTVFCWGDNSGGQLNINPKKSLYSIIPVKMEKLTDVQNMVSGLGYICALLKNNTVKCFGQIFYIDNIKKIEDFNDITLLTGEKYSICILSKLEKVICWSRNDINTKFSIADLKEQDKEYTDSNKYTYTFLSIILFIVPIIIIFIYYRKYK